MKHLLICPLVQNNQKMNLNKKLEPLNKKKERLLNSIEVANHALAELNIQTKDIVNKEFIDRKIQFNKDNDVIYFQDMQFWKHIPDNVIFTIKGVQYLDRIIFTLAAKGYGEQPEYGNGAIYVNFNDLKTFKFV
jgi:hypothetical protein